MTAKILLPSQCDLLHNSYGADNCCLCAAKFKIWQLEAEIEEMRAKNRALEMSMLGEKLKKEAGIEAGIE